jgi:hypothetical protein
VRVRQREIEEDDVPLSFARALERLRDPLDADESRSGPRLRQRFPDELCVARIVLYEEDPQGIGGTGEVTVWNVLRADRIGPA